MILVEQRISDRRILKLIRKWLKVGVVEDNEYRESEIGSPQGSSISPLLSNIYLNYFDSIWDKYYKHLGTLVRFADDFIIISKAKKDIYHAYSAVKKIFERLELQLHPDKTRFVNMWGGEEGFDFLGFHHRRSLVESWRGKWFHTTIQIPTKKAMKSIREKMKGVLSSRTTLKMDMYDLVQTMNRKIVGLRNYYNLKYAHKQLNKIDWYIIQRFTIWYNNKKQRRPRHRGVKEVINKLNEMGLMKLCY